MAIDHKEQARIDALIEVLHHGVGLNDSSIKGTFKIIGKKLINDIPLGAESPTFVSRKRFVLFSLQSQRINHWVEVFVSLVMLLIVMFMVWAIYPDIKWWLFIIIAIVVYWVCLSFKNLGKIKRLIAIVKAQQQIYPDPVAQVQTQSVYTVQQQTKQFAQSRMYSRLIALFIMLMSGYTMSLYTADTPDQLTLYYAVAPFMFMLAVGLLFYPINKAENLHLYGVTQIPFKYMPFGMKVCLFIGTVLSLSLFVLDTFLS